MSPHLDSEMPSASTSSSVPTPAPPLGKRGAPELDTSSQPLSKRRKNAHSIPTSSRKIDTTPPNPRYTLRKRKSSANPLLPPPKRSRLERPQSSSICDWLNSISSTDAIPTDAIAPKDAMPKDTDTPQATPRYRKRRTSSSSRTSTTDTLVTRPSSAASMYPPGDQYKRIRLEDGKIFLRKQHHELPDEIAKVVDPILNHRNRDAKPPNFNLHRARLAELEEGTAESVLQDWYMFHVLPHDTDLTECFTRQALSRNICPDGAMSGSPDVLYAFKRIVGRSDLTAVNVMSGFAPFLTFEFKANGPSGGANLYAGTSQIMGTMAAMLNVGHDFADDCFGVMFGAVISATEIRGFVAYREEGVCYVHQVARFYPMLSVEKCKAHRQLGCEGCQDPNEHDLTAFWHFAHNAHNRHGAMFEVIQRYLGRS